MIASAKPRRSRESVPAWHTQFVGMLPAIVTHARIAFRNLRPEARAEAVQAVVCNACAATARLAELGKLDLAYASVLARFGVAQVKDGRMTGGHLNCKDALSPYCQRVKGVVVERLDHYDQNEECWEELVVQDRHAGPAEVVATKLDFTAWLRTLPSRLRKIAKVLATGEQTNVVARMFGLSDGRISQLRSELAGSWLTFVGEPKPTGAAA